MARTSFPTTGTSLLAGAAMLVLREWLKPLWNIRLLEQAARTFVSRLSWVKESRIVSGILSRSSSGKDQ